MHGKYLDLYYKNAVNKKDTAPAAISCIQTFSDFLGINPYLHIPAADGCFKDNGLFYVAGADVNAESPEPLFRHKILSMLKKTKEFEATDFIASLCSHIPDKNEQMVKVQRLLQQCMQGQTQKTGHERIRICHRGGWI